MKPIQKKSLIEEGKEMFNMFISTFLVLFIAASSFTSCGTKDEIDKPEESKEIPVSNVTITPPAAGIELTAGGGTITLTVVVEPANATDKTVNWSSSNVDIATVSNAGVVTGVKQGNVTISATTKSGNKKADFPIEVKPDPKAVIELTNAMINNPNATLAAGVYQVKSSLTLNGGNNLTISPGVTIRFDKDRRLAANANAKIIAKGTSSQPITFTSSLQTQSPGDWEGIYLYGTNNEFDRCVFEYGASQGSGWGMLYLDNGTVSITNCTFRNSKHSAIYLYRNDSRLTTFSGNTITNCGEDAADSYPILVNGNLSCLGDMGENVINTAKGIGVSGGTVPRNITIKAFVPYLFYGNPIINNAAIVTIEPGAKLKFDKSRRISIEAGAKIIAEGTSSKPITFTSSRATPEPGDWEGVYLYSNASDFKYCIFEYGASQGSGWGMLFLDDCKAGFTNCTFRNTKYSAIYLYRVNSGFTTFDNNSLTNCGENEANSYPILINATPMSLSVFGGNNTITSAKGIGIAGGTVNGDLTLRKYLYTIYSNITVSQTTPGATLTVLPGAELRFTQNTRLSIGSGGKLVADGTASSKIIFTGSTKDKGWWYGIYFDNNNALSGSLLNYCEISYGGKDYGNIYCYTIRSGVLTVRNCTITHSRTWGILVWPNAYPTVESNNTYSNNGPNNNSNIGSTVIPPY